MLRQKFFATALFACTALVILTPEKGSAWMHGGGWRGGYGWGGWYGGYYPYSYYSGWGYSPWYSGYSYGYSPNSYYYPSYSYYPGYTSYYATAPSYYNYGYPSGSTNYTYGALASPTSKPQNSATLEVRVPNADAEVWLEQTKTQQQGMTREFMSPTLTPGTNYSYDVRARWTENGREVDQTRHIAVRANERAIVDFTQPAPNKS